MSIFSDEILRGGYIGTDDEIAAAFAGLVPEFRDESPHTWARLAERLVGLGVAKEIAYALDVLIAALPSGSMLCRYFDAGANLANDHVRDMLLTARQGQDKETQALLDLVLQCGVKNVEAWKKLGLPSMPTANDVAVARKEIAARAWVEQIKEEAFHDRALDGKSISDVKAAIAAAELRTVPDVARPIMGG